MSYEQPNSDEYKYDVTVYTVDNRVYSFMAKYYGRWEDETVTWDYTDKGKVRFIISRIECVMQKENLR